MRINPFVFGILVLAIFMGTILGFQAAGIWSVSGKITTDGQAVQPSAADVNTIKGWMTLEQITTTYHVPLAELLAQFDLPADTPASMAIKDLESEVFSVTNLRDWLLTRLDDTAALPVEHELAPITPTTTPELAPTATVHAAADRTITGKTTFQAMLDWGVSKEAIQAALGGDLPPTTTIIKDYVTGKGLEFSLIKTALQAEVDQAK